MKNFFCRNMLTLITIGVLVTALIVPIVAQTYFVGDLNNDSKLNAVDASLLNATITGTKELQTINVENGKSAYELAVQSGYTGTLTEWLESLKGEKGDKGDQGVDGKSAYELYCEAYPEYTGTMEEWLDALKGEKGDKGEKGEAGRSVSSLSFNELGELLVLYSDGSEQNLGKIKETSIEKPVIKYSLLSDGTYGVYAGEGAADVVSIDIPSTYEGVEVTQILTDGFKDLRMLQEISLPNTIIEIGINAFNGCISLDNVNIPESVSIINDYAFYECTNLTNITLSEGLLSIGKYAFSGCTSLEEITIPASLTIIKSYAFYECSNLQCVGFLVNSGWKLEKDVSVIKEEGVRNSDTHYFKTINFNDNYTVNGKTYTSSHPFSGPSNNAAPALTDLYGMYVTVKTNGSYSAHFAYAYFYTVNWIKT